DVSAGKPPLRSARARTPLSDRHDLVRRRPVRRQPALHARPDALLLSGQANPPRRGAPWLVSLLEPLLLGGPADRRESRARGLLPAHLAHSPAQLRPRIPAAYPHSHLHRAAGHVSAVAIDGSPS